MRQMLPAEHLLTAAQIAKAEEAAIGHPLNPNSDVYLRRLGATVGRKRVVVTLARVPPDNESFIYHAHKGDEEWVYIPSGRSRAEIGDQAFEVAAGDFIAFPVPSVSHCLTNLYEEDLVYLMGGERAHVEVAEFPNVGKHIILAADGVYLADSDKLRPMSFGQWLHKQQAAEMEISLVGDIVADCHPASEHPPAMPSFDIVSKTDLAEIDNALNGMRREIETRFDFKGSKCTIERKDNTLTIIADDDMKLRQMQDLLKGHVVRRKLDAGALDLKPPEKAAGSTLRQIVTVKQGIDAALAKEIVKAVKDSKLKVQASIQGDELRVTGKKRDELQAVIQLVRALKITQPLQYVNFRD
jgi:uncharacterized protein YajQ (UPF0234 family)/uncharacterized cupin superfamily protein